ncbi:hypothetical protein JB92DRAFT_2977321, partial [Gautieria morchelliformis]
MQLHTLRSMTVCGLLSLLLACVGSTRTTERRSLIVPHVNLACPFVISACTHGGAMGVSMPMWGRGLCSSSRLGI